MANVSSPKQYFLGELMNQLPAVQNVPKDKRPAALAAGIKHYMEDQCTREEAVRVIGTNPLDGRGTSVCDALSPKIIERS